MKLPTTRDGIAFQIVQSEVTGVDGAVSDELVTQAITEICCFAEVRHVTILLWLAEALEQQQQQDDEAGNATICEKVKFHCFDH